MKWQIPGEPLAVRYNWCQGPVPGRGQAVEKHCPKMPGFNTQHICFLQACHWLPWEGTTIQGHPDINTACVSTLTLELPSTRPRIVLQPAYNGHSTARGFTKPSVNISWQTTSIGWGKFSQKHNYEYMAKWWCLLLTSWRRVLLEKLTGL